VYLGEVPFAREAFETEKKILGDKLKQYGVQIVPDGDGLTLDFNKALRDMGVMVGIRSNAMFLMAVNRGMGVTEEELDAAMASQQARFKSREEWAEFLAGKGYTIEQQRERVRRFVLQGKLRNQIAGTVDGKKVDAALEQEYDEGIRTNRWEKADVYHIMVLVTDRDDQNAWTAARAKIDQARKRIEDGEDWAVVADEVSDDSRSKRTGGLLKSIQRGILPPEVDDVVFSINPDTLSEPVRSELGWHIVKVTQRRTDPPPKTLFIDHYRDERRREWQMEALDRALAEGLVELGLLDDPRPKPAASADVEVVEAETVADPTNDTEAATPSD